MMIKAYHIKLVIWTAIGFLIAAFLFGCTPTTPTSSIAHTITQDAQDAKDNIKATKDLEQCKKTSVAEINSLVRQANDMEVSCRAEVASKKKDTRFWFFACMTALSAIGIYTVLRIKKAIGI